MRQVLAVLRLKFESTLGLRGIGSSTGLGRTTVSDYLTRFAASGLTWPLPEEMDEAQLEARLFPPTPHSSAERATLNCPAMEIELRRKGVTLSLLWEEYRVEHKEKGYQFSRFCQLYADWRGKTRLWMRQHHKAGEKLFVDYSGDGLTLVDPVTGDVRPVKLFVAALGASSYTFAYATPDEKLPSYLDCHVKAYEFLGGVTEITVTDNLRSGVTKADRFEPVVNRSYLDMATHYGTVIIPARPRKPKDKAKVEVAVQVAQRWIIAVLRRRTFYNMADLNDAIAELLVKLNARVMKHLGVSRVELFKTLDAPALKPLPHNRYEYAQWCYGTVHPDYHLDVERHFYSVPYQHRGKEVTARVTTRTVEIELHGKRIATHVRNQRKFGYSTLKEHMPPAHLYVADSTVEQMRERGGKVGANTLALFEKMMTTRQHPEHAVKSCQGVLSLVRTYGAPRVDSACHRALLFGASSSTSVKNILRNNLDTRPPNDKSQVTLPLHENIRGSSYFH